ncbi:MAG: hypothetical protein ACQEP3_03105 [Patescibacteria group bacterium]
MKRKEIVVTRQWVVGILAVVLVFEKAITYSPKTEIVKDKGLKNQERNRTPEVKRRLMRSESGSQNKYITRRG